MLAHPQGERLGAAQCQPAVERPGHRAGPVLDEREPLGEVVPRRDQHPAHHVAVAVQVLGRGVEHEVGPELEGALEVRSRERIVHDEQCARPARDLAGSLEVAQAHHRVCRRLDVDHLGVWGDRVGDAL